MRDYIVLAIILLSASVALFSPYYGILVWTWIAYFNPHRYGWGVAHNFQVAMVVAVPTLAGCLFARKNLHIFIREAVLLALLWMWFVFTTLYIAKVPAFAGHTQDARLHLEQVSKILLMTFVTILLVTSKERLRILVLVIVASFGFRALFAAIFFIKTGGQFKIWGPEGTFLEDNNDFALALNMTIPMFFFLAHTESRKWVRITIRALMVCVIISVIGTYSRGGLVGLAVVTAVIVAKSRQKFISASLAVIGVFCVLTFSATQWMDRMVPFVHGKLDDSAESRLITWRLGWNLAMDYPIAGGGFDVYTDSHLFPVPAGQAHLFGPHSIYFQMLGEQGFVGLGLFLLLLGTCYGTTRKLRKRARLQENLEWVIPYTHMFEVSLLAYMASGATLGRAYFDFSYQVIACIIVLKLLYWRELQSLAVSEAQVVNTMEAIET
jgi:putative inorganic carbon (hco3(-)) transporter